MKPSAAVIALALALACAPACAEYARSRAVLRAFVKENACPATGLHRMPCPGYHIDHIRPLCMGGPDAVGNLQWITREAHKAKTRIDLRNCRAKRRAEGYQR